MAEDFFKVKESAELGRYGVASKDLKAGEIVFHEEPFTVGPKTDSGVVCLGCNSPLEDLELCSICSWPLCTDCNGQSSNLHKDNECKVFKDSGALFQNSLDENGICHQLDCITPLR